MYPKQTLNTFSNIAAYAAATENHCAPISVKLVVPSPHFSVMFVKAHNVHYTKCTECTNAIKMERKIIRYVDYEHWELCVAMEGGSMRAIYDARACAGNGTKTMIMARA